MDNEKENDTDKVDNAEKKVSKSKGKKTAKPKKVKAVKKGKPKRVSSSVSSNYPRHSVTNSLRIPRAIIEQNAGKECTDEESAKYLGVGHKGPYQLEISSATKYGLLERTGTKRIKPTDLAKKIIKPHTPEDQVTGLREAVLKAPTISDVYKH